MRNLKVLGLALVAMFAMSAFAASAASAVNFTSESSTTFLTGEEESQNVFSVNSREVKCSQASYTGEISGTSVATVTVKPSYSECTGFGFPATVNMNGCDYTFTASSSTAGAAAVDCPEGKEITVDIFTTKAHNASETVCEVHIPAQTPGTPTVDYSTGTVEGKHDITVKATVAGITATVTHGPHGGLIACGTSGHRTNGTFTGPSTVVGYSDEAHSVRTGITVD